MKKSVLFVILGSFILGACSSTNFTSRKKLSGIDYSAYERPVSFIPQEDKPADEDFIAHLPGPSVLDEMPQDTSLADGQNQPQEPLGEDEDFTSEEIEASYGRYADVTVVAAAKRVRLGNAANSKNMAIFQKALDEAYKKALRTYRPAGFTYSIASVGAVNPLSDIEVSCILGEQAANEIGKPTCDLFFQTIVLQYNTLLKEAQSNAAL
ncbi:MAG: hypothetical protein IKJ44_04735 [Elusimicrobiaceae bacterium]|nr:hypothetical protein [Elusimicrobiaceae bacterium]